MAPHRNAFLLLILVLYTFQTVGQTIVLDQSLLAAATVSESPADPTTTGSLRISVSDDGTIDIYFPLNVRNEIGFILETESDVVNRTTQIQEVLINNNYDIQKKGLESAFAVEVAGLVAILFAKPLAAAVPVHLHLPPGNAMNQLKAAASASPTPKEAIYEENAQDPGSVVAISLVDEPAATGSSETCPTGLILCNDCLGTFPQNLCQSERPGCPCVPLATFQHDFSVAATAWASMTALWASPASTIPAASQSTGPICTSTTSGYGCNAPKYCLCGSGIGIIAPLTTTVVSGTTTSNCNYTVQPAVDNCPPAQMTTLATTTTTVPTATAANTALTLRATVSASCYPTVNVAEDPNYNFADITSAASTFCTRILAHSPLSSPTPLQAWNAPNDDSLLILRAALQGPRSCDGYKDADECFRDMCEIMQQCPGLGGIASASCAGFLFRVASIS